MYLYYSGAAHCNSEIFTSVSNVTSLSFFMRLQGFGTGNSSSTLPPPQFWAPSCSSEFLNGHHVSCLPNVWSELAFEDCHNDLG